MTLLFAYSTQKAGVGILLRYLPRYFDEALLDRGLVLDVKPEYSGILVSVSLCVGNDNLCLANTAETVENNDATASIRA